MADVPEYRGKTKTIHEWVIGSEYADNYARTLRDGILFAERAIAQFKDTSKDDAYKWKTNDEGQLIIYIEIEEDS
jgi:hypothetical protein